MDSLNLTAHPRAGLEVPEADDVRFFGHQDNEHCAVDVWALELGSTEYRLNLIKSYRIKDFENAYWLIGSIRQNGRDVWSYQTDSRVCTGFKGIAFTHVHEGKTYVLFVNSGSDARVQHIVPLLHLVDAKKHPDLTPAERGKLKRSLMLSSSLEVEIFDDERSAAFYRRIQVDCRPDNGHRLIKVEDREYPRFPRLVGWEIVDCSGEVVDRYDPMPLARARKRFGHVPETLLPNNHGVKTNVGGANHVKGPSGGGGHHSAGKGKKRKK